MIKPGQIKKEYLLLGAVVLLLVLCYQLAFRKTADAWHIHKQLQSQLAQSSNVNFQPGYSERKSANIGRILNLYKADTINFRSNIISRISSIAEKENVKLSELPTEDLARHQKQLIIQKLGFEGDYFSLIKTINHLQATSGIGIMRSITIKKPDLHTLQGQSEKLALIVNLEINE